MSVRPIFTFYRNTRTDVVHVFHCELLARAHRAHPGNITPVNSLEDGPVARLCGNCLTPPDNGWRQPSSYAPAWLQTKGNE